MTEIKKYLLDISGFFDASDREKLFEQAFSRVDDKRREKAGCIKRERSRAASLGAALLLQLAVQEAEGLTAEEQTAGGLADSGLAAYTVPQLLELLSQPIPLEYRYGEGGKPYFKNSPWYFNISHSGDYVICVLSRGEVGADIQLHRAGEAMKLAERFFSPEEIRALKQAEDERSLFFRLWARKEACGKLTGEGLAGVIGKNLLPDGADSSGEFFWEEYDILSGYSIAVCRYGGGMQVQQ